jgi:hypothetical protein
MASASHRCRPGPESATTSPNADAVVAREDQPVKQVHLRPGERVVGRGQPIGTVYRLADGRTIVVRADDW